MTNSTKVNIGCGMRYMDDAVNVDINPAFEPDIVQDLSEKPWDLESNSYDIVIANNILEHIPPKDRITMISECHRILTVGGKLRVRHPTPGYGCGWDMSHYCIPHWNWYQHPNHRDHWDLLELHLYPFGIGKILPKGLREIVQKCGIRAVRGYELVLRTLPPTYDNADW